MDTVELNSDDRLSTRADKFLFFGIFITTSILIVVQKLFAVSKWIPAVTGATAIALFCVLSWKTPRFRLREDRIGDGAYYLGFLFTLVSLSVTLYQFTRSGGVEEVISGFGIALTTTIVGLSLRV